MIKEKYIERLPERNEALKRGFELTLTLFSINENWKERIKLNKLSLVTWYSTADFLNCENYAIVDSSANISQIDWFDIQPPKMRKMTLIEIHDYLIKERKILCRKTVDGLTINVPMNFNDIKYLYEEHGTFAPDGTFNSLPLTEEKNND